MSSLVVGGDAAAAPMTTTDLVESSNLVESLKASIQQLMDLCAECVVVPLA